MAGAARVRAQALNGERAVLYFIIKSALSGLIIGAVSEASRRAPALGALIVSLPLVFLLSVVWLWRDTGGDIERIAATTEATFWYVLPTLPMFLVVPALLRHGVGFWPALAAGCALTIALYAIMIWLLARFGISL